MRAKHIGKGNLGAVAMLILAGVIVTAVIAGVHVWQQHHLDKQNKPKVMETYLSMIDQQGERHHSAVWMVNLYEDPMHRTPSKVWLRTKWNKQGRIPYE